MTKICLLKYTQLVSDSIYIFGISVAGFCQKSNLGNDFEKVPLHWQDRIRLVLVYPLMYSDNCKYNKSFSSDFILYSFVPPTPHRQYNTEYVELICFKDWPQSLCLACDDERLYIFIFPLAL